MIDIFSRALFVQPFKVRRNLDIPFLKLYKKIRKYMKPVFLQDPNRQVYIYSDEDFSMYNKGNLINTFKPLEKRFKLKFLLLTKTKPYLLDRVSRSIRGIISYEFQHNNKITLAMYNNLIKRAVKLYNLRSHSALSNKSPLYVLHHDQKISFYPTNFNYVTNKAELLTKLKNLRTKIWPLTPVRIFKTNKLRNLNKWKKRFESSFYTKEILYLESYKVPAFSNDPIKLILMNKKGLIYTGQKSNKQSVYTLIDIKILSHKDYRLTATSLKPIPNSNLFFVKVKGIKKTFKLTKEEILKTVHLNQNQILLLSHIR